MKIIHIISSLDRSAGGPSRSVPQTCAQLARLGHKIEIITHPSKDPVEIKHEPNLSLSFKTHIQLLRFSSTISKENVNLIHLQHVWDPYIHIMARAARKRGIPYVITPRGMLEPWIMSQRPWKKKLGMYLYQRKDLDLANMLHATCNLEAENIRELGIKTPIQVIPNGLDLSPFPKSVPVKTNEPKKILFLSRIHPKKGIELLIDAWQQLNPEVKKGWVIEIVGNGEEQYINSLKQKISQANLQNEIIIKPPLFGESKVNAFREASLFVLPTFSENFGIVVAEALASYTPVITTTGTPWEELDKNKCGWYIELSLENLTNAVFDAMQKSSETLRIMSINGRSLVEENYAIGLIANKMNAFYRNNV